MDDVLIVSAWNRGTWLAQQLRKNLLKVKVLDVSSLLPTISSVEREGPFGVFAPDDLSDIEKKYLRGDNYYSQSQGFCVLNSSGPIEFQGLNSDFMRDTKTNVHLCKTVLSADSAKRKQLLHKKDVAVNWLVQLARKWAASLPTIRDEQLSPLFAPYLYRETSSRFFEDLYREEQAWGVQRVNVNQLTHITTGDNYITLQAEGEKHSARTVVWALSVLEILHIFPQLPALLPRKWQMPDWVWQRFNLSWDLSGFEDILPMLIFILSDHQVPGYGANAMSIKRYPGSSQADLWMLCPYNISANNSSNLQDKEDLHKLQDSDNSVGADVLAQQSMLSSLFPGFSVACSRSSSDSESGRCSYFVCYEKDDINKSILKAHPLMFFLNPESIGKMDAYSLFKGAMKIQEQLLKRLKGSS